MLRLALLLFCLPILASAHDVQLVSQYVDLGKAGGRGIQEDLIGRVDLNRKWKVGLQGTYLERFDLYEKRAGGSVQYRPTDSLTVEARYLQGMGNDILAEKDGYLAAYYALAPGYSPYFIYRHAAYSVTDIDTYQLGVEIEKIRNIILIPQVLLGNATFKAPNETKGVYSVGLRAVYYEESNYSLFAFAYKGKEASQGIIGKSSILVDTTTFGGGAGYNFTPNTKAELIFDHTDYEELKNQFMTTTLNLVWVI